LLWRHRPGRWRWWGFSEVSGALKLIEFGASGPEALKAIREADHQGKPFNIVLLDKRMPDMDGIEVAQNIRAEQHPLQPLISRSSSIPSSARGFLLSRSRR
jgi:CheY-like chemotaxis protein